MHVEISDPEYTDDLAVFLRRCECTVHVVAPGLLEAEPRVLPIDPALRHSRLELDAYVGIWSAIRHTRATVVEPATR